MLATVVVCGTDARKVMFGAEQHTSNQAAEVIRPLVEQWSRSDGVEYTVVCDGQLITVKFTGGNNMRRTTKGVADTLRSELQQNGIRVYFQEFRDYTEREAHADACVGWQDGEPGAD